MRNIKFYLATLIWISIALGVSKAVEAYGNVISFSVRAASFSYCVAQIFIQFDRIFRAKNKFQVGE
jgi:hypothetical protein